MVGLGFFVGRVVCVFVPFHIFVGPRGGKSKKASVGRVVGSEFDTSEQKNDKTRSAKLVVRFDSGDVTNKKQTI